MRPSLPCSHGCHRECGTANARCTAGARGTASACGILPLLLLLIVPAGSGREGGSVRAGGGGGLLMLPPETGSRAGGGGGLLLLPETGSGTEVARGGGQRRVNLTGVILLGDAVQLVCGTGRAVHVGIRQR